MGRGDAEVVELSSLAPGGDHQPISVRRGRRAGPGRPTNPDASPQLPLGHAGTRGTHPRENCPVWKETKPIIPFPKEGRRGLRQGGSGLSQVTGWREPLAGAKNLPSPPEARLCRPLVEQKKQEEKEEEKMGRGAGGAGGSRGGLPDVFGKAREGVSGKEA